MNSYLARVTVCFCLLLFGGSGSANAAERKLVYAVFWDGCEEVCRGLQDYLGNSGMEAELVVRDVGRDKTRFASLVQEARTLKADVVVTWGTTTTLGIIGTLDDVRDPRYLNDLPVVFTMVSDPVRSRIIASYAKTGRSNVTGTRNRVPEALNIKTMRKIKPAFKRLGIIYNQFERNSVDKVDEVRELQKAMDFELIAVELELDEQGKPRADSIPRQVRQLKERGVDFIYLGSSVFLEQQMDLFTGAAVENGLPVLSPYENLVRDSQAYLSVAARDYDVGLLAGEQVKKILVDGRLPGDLSVSAIEHYAYVINMTTAKKINLFPSVDMLQMVEIVE